MSPRSGPPSRCDAAPDFLDIRVNGRVIKIADHRHSGTKLRAYRCKSAKPKRVIRFPCFPLLSRFDPLHAAEIYLVGRSVDLVANG
jgi:hypothetical protein